MSDGPLALTQARGGLALSVTTIPLKAPWPGCPVAGVRVYNSAESDSAVVVAVVDEEQSDFPPLTQSEMAALIASGAEAGWIWGELQPGNSGWIPFGSRAGGKVSLYLWTREGTAEAGAIFCR